MTHEFNDDGNPEHYRNQDNERGSDFIELTKNEIFEVFHHSKLSENAQ